MNTIAQKQCSIKSWLLASRPKTLPVSLPPLIVGSALASQIVYLNWVLVISALFCSLGIQIGTNLVNDALDFKKGADGKDRLGPSRMTQEGHLSFQQVLFAGCLCFVLALLFALPLILAGGWPILGILLLSIACGYLYTGGPFPLAYLGISDPFVLIFFGWVSTGTLYYLQTGMLNFSCFLAATQIGLLAIVPHAINNLRDQKSDALAKKKTLAVRFGAGFVRLEITILSLLPFLMGFLWIKMGHSWASLLPFFALPAILKNLFSIWKTEPSVQYNEFLAKSALCQLFFSCLLALGFFL